MVFGIEFLNPKVGNTEQQITDSNNKTYNVNAREDTQLQYWLNHQVTNKYDYKATPINAPTVVIQSPDASVKPTLHPEFQETFRQGTKMLGTQETGGQELDYEKSNIAGSTLPDTKLLVGLGFGVVALFLVIWGISKWA